MRPIEITNRPTMTDEGRHNLAIHRLLEAAIRKGEEIEELEQRDALAKAGKLEARAKNGGDDHGNAGSIPISTIR